MIIHKFSSVESLIIEHTVSLKKNVGPLPKKPPKPFLQQIIIDRTFIAWANFTFLSTSYVGHIAFALFKNTNGWINEFSMKLKNFHMTSI